MDSARIEDLKRRIQRDPSSIAFAQLGEEYRRAGRPRDAIETCRAGLNHHPGYLSARVTLGRALLELGDLEPAERELKEVLRVAPENLAALRGLAETMVRRGDRVAALAYYQAAVALAPRDLELQNAIASLGAEIQRAASPPAPSRVPLAPVARTTPAAPPTPVPTVHEDQYPVTAASSAPTAAADEAAARAVPALERWLQAIVEDRNSRTENR
jgi:tetratricopeptide (TPR) repeat protein